MEEGKEHHHILILFFPFVSAKNHRTIVFQKVFQVFFPLIHEARFIKSGLGSTMWQRFRVRLLVPCDSWAAILKTFS